jgi:hypothetical protein
VLDLAVVMYVYDEVTRSGELNVIGISFVSRVGTGERPDALLQMRRLSCL